MLGPTKRGWRQEWSSHQVCPQPVSSLYINKNVSEIPVNEYYEYFGPDYILDVKSSNTDDLNTTAYLDRVKRIVLENVRHIGGPPSVQMTGKSKGHV